MRNFLDHKTYLFRNKLIIQIEANCLFHLFLDVFTLSIMPLLLVL